MNVFARKTAGIAATFMVLAAAASVFSLQAHAASTSTTFTIDGASVTSAVPLKYEDGKYVFDESSFAGMNNEQIDNLLKEMDMPPGRWETAEVQKTKKGYALQNGEIVSVDIPYTVEVRTGYVFDNSHIIYKGLAQGSEAPEINTFKYDTPTFDLPPATNTSKWLFEGWYTGENGTGLRIDQVKQFTKSDVIVYANYIPNFYIVRFSANGGDGLIDDVEVNRNADFLLPRSSMRKTGYTFVGWNTNPDRSGDMFSDQAKINNLTVFNDIALYAQYDPITYMVSFNANGGTGTMQTQSITYGASMALSASAMEKEGMKFAGWNTEANGSGEWYGNESIVRNLATSEKEVVTLYAQYEDPASPNPFENMTGTVFAGDSIFADFNPVTTSYNMDGMPKQISISGTPVNFAVESVETSEISEVQGANTVEKSQQTSVKIRYYGATETKERVYKFNWTWTEGVGSAFGKEITTVPMFKHGTKYLAGSYAIGTDIAAGSYLIEHEASAETVLLKKKGTDKPYAMKDAHSYDLASGDNITAEVPFYLIEEFDTSTMNSSGITVGAIQMVNEAASRGGGLYATVDPLKGAVPGQVIGNASAGLTDAGSLVKGDSSQPVTNDVIETVKQEEMPEYIKNEVNARANTTYEVIEPEDEIKDKDVDDVEISAYYGKWKFASFTERTQKIMREAERKDKIPPQYNDGTYHYSDNYMDEIRTVDDFAEADNQIEIKSDGTVTQIFKYKDEPDEYTSYASWEKIEKDGKLEGIRISAYDSNYTVTATIMSGKLVLDRTSMYASIFEKIAEPSSGSSMSAQATEPPSGGGGLSMQTQATENFYGFVSPYSVFGFGYVIYEHIEPIHKNDPKIYPGNPINMDGKTNTNNGNVSKNENKDHPANNANTSQSAKNETTEKEPAKPAVDETLPKSDPDPEPDVSFEEQREQPQQPQSQPQVQPEPDNPASELVVQADPDKQDVSSGDQPKPEGEVESRVDGILLTSHINDDGTITYTETAPDGTQTTWVVDATIAPEPQPTHMDITAKFEQIAKNLSGMSPETIKIISENIKRNLEKAGENVTNGISDIAIVNAIEEAKQEGLLSEEQSRTLKSNARNGNRELFHEKQEQAIRDFVNRLPDGGTRDGEVLTGDGDHLTAVPLDEFNRNDRIENRYQNYNAANAPVTDPRNNKNNNNNNTVNKEPQMKDDSSGFLSGDGIIAQIASNDVLRAGIVGLPVLIIVLIAAFMFTRSDER